MLVRLRGSRRDCVLSDAEAFLMRMSEYGDDVGSGLGDDDDVCRRSRRLSSFLTRLVDRSPALSAGCRRASKVEDWPWEAIVGDTRGAAFRFSNELECGGKEGGDVCNAGGRRMVGLESNFCSRLQNCVASIVVK